MTPSKMEEFLEVDERKPTIQPPTPFEQGFKKLLDGYDQLSKLDNLTSIQKKGLGDIHSGLQKLQVQDENSVFTETTPIVDFLFENLR